MNKRLFYFLPALAWFILSFYLLTIPGPQVPKINWLDKIQGDQLVHIALFGILVSLVILPLQRLLSRPTFTLMLWVSLFALAYGIAMEFVQEYFVDNRSFDFFDMVADGAGSFIPTFYWKYAQERKTAT